MNATTAPVVRATIVAVDLVKNVFQLAFGDGAWRVVESHRLARTQFERWFGLTPREHPSGGTRHRGRISSAAAAIGALANKLARTCHATLRDDEPNGAARLNKKVTRTAFPLPA
jgi:hypothetical protein